MNNVLKTNPLAHGERERERERMMFISPRIDSGEKERISLEKGN
jgi:hypothetical protein